MARIARPLEVSDSAPWFHRISAALWSNQVEIEGPLPVPSIALPTKVKQRWDTDN